MLLLYLLFAVYARLNVFCGAKYLQRSGQVSGQTLPYYVQWVNLAYRFAEIKLDNFLLDEKSTQFLCEFTKEHEELPT